MSAAEVIPFPKVKFDHAAEIEALRDHLAWIAIHTGKTSHNVVVELAAMYHMRVVEV